MEDSAGGSPPREIDRSIGAPVPANAEANVPVRAANAGNRWLVGVGVLVGVMLLVAAGIAIGGEAERFFSVGIQFVPLAILGALAYLGARSAGAAVAAYIWLALLALGVLLVALGYTLFAYVRDFSLLGRAMRDPGIIGDLGRDSLFKPGIVEGFLWAVLLLFIVTLLSLSMLLRPVRVFVARFTHTDPDNFVHKIALVFLTLVLFSSFVPLIVLGGRPPLLELLGSGSMDDLGMGDLVRPQDLIYQLVWTVPATLVAAGWLTRRRFGETLVRLGVVRPTLPQVGLGVGAALAMAAFSMLALDPGIRALWEALGWPVTDVETFGRLLGNLITPVGAVLVGVTAGIGEEMAVRGLLQPRVGLVLSNLIFTSFHAYQYGADALLSVFLVGLALGVIRHYTNTTTSAIAHAVYNFTLIMTEVVMQA